MEKEYNYSYKVVFDGHEEYFRTTAAYRFYTKNKPLGAKLYKNENYKPIYDDSKPEKPKWELMILNKKKKVKKETAKWNW